MSRVVLFSSHDQTIFVLDVPASIESAQRGGCIFSSIPIEAPFATSEPKGEKRGKFIANVPRKYVAYHDCIQVDCERALAAVKHSSDLQRWCLARIHNSGLEDVSVERAAEVSHGTPCLPVVLSRTQNDFASMCDVQNELVHNDNARTAYLVFKDNGSMLIPGHCTFMWSSIKRGLGAVSGWQTGAMHGKPPQFDVILMDPPWANRSVRNTRKYHTTEEQWYDPFQVALAFLDYLQPEGYVAIWITNKAAVREQVLNSLACLGFWLVEEWVWLKITTKGEPVTPLGGVWRKPYELLLFFRRGRATATPTRRLIIAVPDMHSRKPNLKLLFETLLDAQSVLELFARNLTAGWWCVGDEVLKYQDTRFWQQHP